MTIRRTDKLTATECFRDRKVAIAMCETRIRKDRSKKGKSQKIKIRQAVVNCPDGASVLPYLFSKKRGWCVVLVNQYRIAVDAATQEAPGGMVEGRNIKESMARELREETGISVSPGLVEIVFKEYMLPPLVTGVAWGGIVRVAECQLSRKSKWGMEGEGEHTSVSIVSVRKLIHARDKKGMCVLDLWTSRLVDEVVKKIRTLS